MSVSSPTARLGTAFIARAIPALIVALVITFSSNHSAFVGQITFIAWAFVTAPVLLLTVFTVPLEGAARVAVSIQAVAVVVAAGVVAATLGAGLPAFVISVSVWAAVSGLAEIFAGLRSPQRRIAREWLTAGALTALLSLIFAVIPINDVYAVGLFGAYAAILGLVLVIAGITLRSAEPEDKA
jgi:hypothetical protein